MNNDPKNPIAVALHFDGANAPVITAKGEGLVAQKIIETAQKHDIPIENKPMLAEALSKIELDQTIPEELYKAVAEVIAFVMYGWRNDKNTHKNT